MSRYTAILVMVLMLVLAPVAGTAGATTSAPVTNVQEQSTDSEGGTNVSVWEGSVLSIRANTDNAATVVPNQEVFLEYNSSQVNADRTELAVFVPGTVTLDYESINRPSISAPTDENVQFFVGTIDGSNTIDDLAAISGINEESVEALNENMSFEEIDRGRLDENGDLQNASLEHKVDTGAHVVFAATYDEDGKTLLNDNNELDPQANSKIVGVEPLFVADGASSVEGPSTVKPGDNATFTVDNNNYTDHAIVLYDNETYEGSSMTVNVTGDSLADANVSIENEIGEINGNVTETGTFGFDYTIPGPFSVTSFFETILEGSPYDGEQSDVSDNGTVLNASATTFYAEGDYDEVDIDVQTLEDWEETDYRWVHLAINETAHITTSTGMLTLEADDSSDDDDDDDNGGGWTPPSPPGDEDGDKKDKLDVTDASLSTSEIEVGDSVDVSATVTNAGDKAGTYTIKLTVDGDVVDDKDVELEAGASETVTFTRTFNDAGEYDIEIGGASAGTLTVVEPEPEPEPAAFDVSDATLSESEIAAGDSVDVTATVTNTGEESGTHTAELSVDGDVVAEQDVTLEGGESDTVTFTETFDDAGEYDVAVDDSSAGTLTVVAEDDDGDDDGLPGFGALVALVALLSVAALRVGRTTDDS